MSAQTGNEIFEIACTGCDDRKLKLRLKPRQSFRGSLDFNSECVGGERSPEIILDCV